MPLPSAVVLPVVFVPLPVPFIIPVVLFAVSFLWKTGTRRTRTTFCLWTAPPCASPQPHKVIIKQTTAMVRSHEPLTDGPAIVNSSSLVSSHATKSRGKTLTTADGFKAEAPSPLPYFS
jgi:hypothetical protein